MPSPPVTARAGKLTVASGRTSVATPAIVTSTLPATAVTEMRDASTRAPGVVAKAPLVAADRNASRESVTALEEIERVPVVLVAGMSETSVSSGGDIIVGAVRRMM
jgi:hypothetical protein